MRHLRNLWATTLTLGLLLGPAKPALADPQVSVAATVGGGVRDLRTSPEAAFHLGLWADAIFLRQRHADMGIGPYLHVDTLAFDTLHMGTGLSWLVPLGSAAGSVSLGGLVRKQADWSTGLQAALFFGSRNYNFHSTYGFALGGFVQARYGLGASQQAEVVGGLQADLLILALPWVYLYNAVRGRPPTYR